MWANASADRSGTFRRRPPRLLCAVALSFFRRRASSYWAIATSESPRPSYRSEEHTSELQSPCNLVGRLLLEKKKVGSVVAAGDVAACGRRGPIGHTRAPRSQPSHPRTPCVPPSQTTLPWPAPSFFFNDTATTEIYTLSLHDALPICGLAAARRPQQRVESAPRNLL